MTDSDKDRHDRLVKTFLGGGLSAEELERQRRSEYRQSYPKATEAEIQLLMDADDKAGYPPVCIGHARYIMRTSAGDRRPAPTAKDFDDAARVVYAEHHKLTRKTRPAKPVSKKMYDPEAVENRIMSAMFARLRQKREAAKKSSEAKTTGDRLVDEVLAMLAEPAGDKTKPEAAPTPPMGTNTELGQRFVEALSAENIEKQRRHEYHQGHPSLTEAELDMMMAADKKVGRPMGSLAQAKKVLADLTAGTGILRPGLVRPSGERLRALWLIGIALAESLNKPRVPKEGEQPEPPPEPTTNT